MDSKTNLTSIEKIVNRIIVITALVLLIVLLIIVSNNLIFSKIFKFIQFDKFISIVFNLKENESGTAASIGSSLIIFFGGLFVSFLIGLIKGINDRLKKRALFERFIRILALKIDEKGKNFILCANTLDVSKGDGWELKDTTIGYLHEFYQVNYNDFYSAYFNGFENLIGIHNLSSDSFDSIFKNLASIKAVEEIYKERLNRFEDKYNSLNDKLNNCREAVYKHIFNLNEKGKQSEIAHEVNSYLNKINARYLQWKELENHGIPFKIYNELILPILEINKQFSDSTRVQMFVSIDLFFSLKDAENEYLGLRNTVETNSRIIKSYGDTYLKVSKELNSILMDL